MSDTPVTLDSLQARLDGLITAMERLGIDTTPAAVASVDPDGSPSHVAAGELIESAWGNAVVDWLDVVAVAAVMRGAAFPGGRMRVEANYTTVTTNGSGDATVTVGGAGAFNAVPLVVVSSGNPTPIQFAVISATLTSFQFRCWYGSGAGIGNPAANVGVNLWWITIGLRP